MYPTDLVARALFPEADYPAPRSARDTARNGRRADTNADVVAAWVAGRAARNGRSSLLTDGTYLWSYRVAIGWKNARGYRVVVDYRGGWYSVTTSAHVGLALPEADVVLPPEAIDIGLDGVPRPVDGPADIPLPGGRWYLTWDPTAPGRVDLDYRGVAWKRPANGVVYSTGDIGWDFPEGIPEGARSEVRRFARYTALRADVVIDDTPR